MTESKETQSPTASKKSRNIFANLWLALTLLALVMLLVARQKGQISRPPDRPLSNVDLLARVLISEASIGNQAEREAVGLTVINRMKNMRTNQVSDVVTIDGFYHYATDQDPTLYPEYADLARSLLAGDIADFTDGATHFFSPHSMPKQGESRKNFDCEGGLVRYTSLATAKPEEVCTPGWSKYLRYVNLVTTGVRPYYFEFYAE